MICMARTVESCARWNWERSILEQLKLNADDITIYQFFLRSTWLSFCLLSIFFSKCEFGVGTSYIHCAGCNEFVEFTKHICSLSEWWTFHCENYDKLRLIKHMEHHKRLFVPLGLYSFVWILFIYKNHICV